MKKQKTQLIVLSIALFFLAAGYFGLQKYNEQQANKPIEDATIWALNLVGEEVTGLSYTYNEELYSFVKEEGIWKNEEDKTLSLVQSKLNNMATEVSQIEAVQSIENVTDMSAYGLEEPNRTVTFQTTEGTHTVKIGNYNNVSCVYYISVDDSETIYAVESTLITAFGYTLEDLIEESEEETEESESETADDEVVSDGEN